MKVKGLVSLAAFVLVACQVDSPAVTLTVLPSATSLPSVTPFSTASPTASPTPEIAIEEIELITEDGLTLAGRVFTSAETTSRGLAVILAHMGAISGASQESWRGFATLLAGHGITALTFDFRGCGHSEGTLNTSYLVYDIRPAITLLQERGYDRIACVGASMGGSTCLAAALETDFAGLVTIGSPLGNRPPTYTTFADLSALTMPKLFITTDADWALDNAVARTRHILNASAEPKEMLVFPGEAHGTEIFDSAAGADFTQALLDFLESL